MTVDGILPQQWPLTAFQAALVNDYPMAGPAQHTSFRLRPPANTDVDAFVQIVNETLDGHAILRSTVSTGSGGELVQLYRPDLSVDVCICANAERFEAATLDQVASDFDLQRELPTRTSISVVGNRVIDCQITIHHIAFDRTSMWHLGREILQRCAGKRPQIEADFPRAALAAATTSRLTARMAAAKHDANELRVIRREFDQRAAQQIHDSVGAASVPHLLLGAFSALVLKEWPDSRFVVAVGTRSSEAAGVGPFVRTLKADLRKLSPSPPLEMAHAVRRALGRANQLSRILTPLPSGEEHPLLVGFNFTNRPLLLDGQTEPELSDIWGSRGAEVALRLDIEDHSDGWSVDLFYSSAFITDEEAADLVLRLERSLALPDAVLIRELASNAGRSEDFAKLSLELLKSEPGRVAVAGSDSATRADLARWARQFASQICASDTSPGDVVAVCLPSGPARVAAFLGVLLAGRVYLPLDPRQPSQRQSLLLRESSARILIADQGANISSEHIPSRMTLMSGHRPNPMTAIGETFPNFPLSSAAYLMFTSGSTGKPKGVLVSRANLNHLASAIGAVFSRRTPETALLAASPGFDAHIWEMLIGLMTGATMIPADAGNLDSVRVAYNMADVVTATPSVLAALLPESDREKITISAGERLDGRFAERLLEIGEVFNAYGPTEATVCASMADLTRMNRGDAVPIGRPLPGVSLYVLDEILRAASRAHIGELYIGGGGVSLAYINRRRETAAAFLPDPFSSHPGARMYRTGDRVLMRADGQLEYIGRVDDQVKVNGQRVELGEVNAMVRSHPSVRDSVVTTLRTASDLRLVAYVVLDTDVDPIEEMAVWFFTRFASHLVPSTFVSIPNLPLTPSGKVDVRGLPSPFPQAASDASDPSSLAQVPNDRRLEDDLVLIWQETLGMPELVASTNVLYAGASSLDVARAVWRMRHLAPAAAIAQIYSAPVVAAHAQLMLGAASAPGSSSSNVKPHARSRSTALQRQLMLLAARNPRDSRYNVPLIYESSSAIDEGHLAKAMAQVIDRQDALRSVLVERAGSIDLVTQPTSDPASIESKSFDGRSDADAWLDRWVKEPISLDQTPLVRAAIVGHGDGWLLAFLFHHAVFDAESVGIFQRELSASWSNEVVGVTPRSFAEWLDSRDLATDVDFSFWSRSLSGLRPLVGHSLGQDLLQSVEPSTGIYRTLIGPDLSDSIQRLSRQTGSSIFVIVMLALQIVVAARTGRREFAIATPISLRRDQAWDNTMGCFVDTIHIRADIRQEESVDAAMKRLRDVTIAALHHGLAPLSEVLHRRKTKSDSTLLTSVSLQVINTTPGWALGESALTDIRPPSPGNRLDIQFQIVTTLQGLQVDVIYDEAQFGADFIRSLVHDLNEVLTVMLKDVNLPVENSLSTLSSRAAIVSQSADAAYLSDFDFVGRILKTARMFPSRIAVADSAERVTYSDLVSRANGLAALLEAASVQTGDRVAVSVERSIDLVVAMLGVMMTGAIYVPLDSRAPESRNRYILRDCGAAACVVGESTFTDIANVRMQSVVARSQLAPRPFISAEASYLIYTSGSTGSPKGVVVERHNLANLIRAMGQFYDKPNPIRVGLMAPTSFDACWKSIASLAYGHELVIVDHEMRRDPKALASFASRELDLIDATPHDLLALLDATPTVALVGGDKFGPARWDDADSTGRFWNVYGPTEGTVFVALSKVDSRGENIGRPITGTSLYVLDEELRPSLVDASGELYIGGESVSRGYFERRGETARAYLPDPFTEDRGARMYRTGDLAKLREDGTFEFIGRADDQVKVRGYRVEPFEVNAVLSSNPEIETSCVIPITGADSVRLAAYVVRNTAATSTDQELRVWLADHVPEYMVPSWVIGISVLPLTSAGKLDRSALPDPRTNDVVTLVEAGDDIEGTLTRIWKEVLETSQVSRDDNFFDLGGDSISAMQLAARAARFGVEIRSADVFEAQTISTLTLLIDNRSDGTLASSDQAEDPR